MKCDGSPDPTILPEINMYMSLWSEDVDNIDFDLVLNDSDLVLKVWSCFLNTFDVLWLVILVCVSYCRPI